jgi:hypothetical protein
MLCLCSDVGISFQAGTRVGPVKKISAKILRKTMRRRSSAKTEERRQHGRHSRSEGHLCLKSGELGERHR